MPLHLVGFSWGGATALRDRWRDHVAADRWPEAYPGFLDDDNGPDWFASWPDHRGDAFLAEQQARGHVERALCDVVHRHELTSDHVVIDGAGHMMPPTHPEVLTAAVLAHLETVAGVSWG